jgi:hypothetical protein
VSRRSAWIAVVCIAILLIGALTWPAGAGLCYDIVLPLVFLFVLGAGTVARVGAGHDVATQSPLLAGVSFRGPPAG